MLTEQIHTKRIFYGENEHQFGDLRIPIGATDVPVIILVHGGFWKARSGLEGMNQLAHYFSSKGFATWNIEYRRVGHEGGGWPGTFIDVANATDYVTQLAASYPIDLNRVVTIGFSAGGQLAFWTAARHRLPEDSMIRTSQHPIKIDGAISLAGVLDLELMQEVHHIKCVKQKIEDNPVYNLLGGGPDKVPERYSEASPIQLLPLGVKQLLIHGSLDINVPIGISYSYKKGAELANEDVEFVELPNSEHFKLTDTGSDAWPMVESEVMRFLEKV